MTSPAQRLDGLDLARYIAFVGMVIVNFKIAMAQMTALDLRPRFLAFLRDALPQHSWCLQVLAWALPPSAAPTVQH